MVAILVAFLVSQTPELDRLRSECERSLDACRLLETARAKYDAEQEKVLAEKQKVAEAAHAAALESQDREIAAEDAKAEAAEAALRKKCGKDFGRVRVGMAWKRVQQCAGVDLEWSTKAEDERGTIYECANGAVKVAGGKVVRWIAY